MHSPYHKSSAKPEDGPAVALRRAPSGVRHTALCGRQQAEELVTKTTNQGITRRDMAKRALVAAALAPSARLLISQAAAQSGSEIKLGFNGDLAASPSAQSGQAAVLGIQTALEDLNAQGDLLGGRRLTLVIRDDLSQPPKSIQNMSDLIDNEKVVAVFGPTNSGNALAWRHIPNQKRVPVMGCIGSASDITKPASASADNYMFRVSMVDRTQVIALMAYVKKSQNAKRVGFLSETTGYGQGGLKDMQEVAAIQGIKPVANEKFGVNDTDMTSQLQKLRSANVDTAVVWAQGTPIGQLMRSMDKIGYFPALISCWAADNQSFLNAAGSQLAERTIFLRTISEDRTPRQQQFLDRIQSRLPTASAFSFATHGYDAAMLLALAIKQAGGTDGPKLREALEDLRTPYEGVIKTYTHPFSRTDHEALKAEDLRWTRWQNGKLVAYADEVTHGLQADDFKG
jgi:branched-chain amino acid transport system substrate-binding protein